MRNLVLLAGLCPLVACVHAQSAAPGSRISIVNVLSAPSGSCTNGSPTQLVVSTGTLYTCQGGTWGPISGGGASLPSTTNVFKGNGVGGAVAATPGTDYITPTTGTFSQSVLAPNYLTSGTTQQYQQYGVGAGAITLPTGAPANYFGWIGPQSGTPAYFLAGPVSSPTSAGIGEFLVCPNPATVNNVNQSQCVWLDAANLALLNASNTFSGTEQNIASTAGCWAINNDTFLSRNAAGVMQVGTTCNTSSGTLVVNDATVTFKFSDVMIQKQGSIFSTSGGCTESALTGGSTGGHITIGQNTACSTVVTFGTGASATHGWVCNAVDATTNDAVRIVPTSTTTVTISGTFATNDVVWFNCDAV